MFEIVSVPLNNDPLQQQKEELACRIKWSIENNNIIEQITQFINLGDVYAQAALLANFTNWYDII